MQADNNWADHLAAAILAQLAGEDSYEKIHSVLAVSGTAVEIVLSVPGEVTLRGLRVDLAWAESALGRLEGSTPEEIAFSVVHLGILEPRSIDEFTMKDKDGVRWISTENWLED